MGVAEAIGQEPWSRTLCPVSLFSPCVLLEMGWEDWSKQLSSLKLSGMGSLEQGLGGAQCM